MEQIIGLIVVILIGAAADFLKKKFAEGSRKKRARANTTGTWHVPVVPLTPARQETHRPAPVLNIDRQETPVQGVPPVPVVAETVEPDEPQPIAAMTSVDDETDSDIERWRRAVIDSEILARRF